MSDAPSSSESPESEKNLFGQVAIDLGLVNAEQLDGALKFQDEQPKLIGARRKIGEILHDRHVIELRAIQKVLLEQMRRRMTAPEPARAHERKIGHFEILAKLGAGGMGHVYKAHDTVQDRVVALKVLSLRLTDDAEFVARFQREVTASSSLQHPNIVAGISSGSLDGRPYLTMEFVDGLSLGKVIDAEVHLPERKALLITREVARGLDFAHSKGVVHRDVKPDNVLVGENVVKLTDFGLAKILQDDQRLTRSGIALGTPHYISPEQVEASRYIDHRADLYGLGAMLFHMLTGHVPFEGDNNNEIMLKHLNDPMRDTRQFVPGISENAILVLKKLMAKKAADRYDSASQLLEDLDLLLDEKPLRHATRLAPEKPGKAGCGAMFLVGLAFILYLAK